MRKLIARMTTSLDGFVQGPNGAMNWMAPSDDHWRDTFSVIDGADAVVVGRTMYPDYGKHWTEAPTSPTASESERAYGRIARSLKHYVVSRSLKSAPFFGAAILRGLDDVARLKEEPGKDIIAWGGATLVSVLVAADLADEIHLVVNPVILGGGKALFRDGAPKRLALAGTKTFDTGVVVLRYQPTRG